MPGESLIIDSTTEDAANVPLDIVDNTSFFLLEHAYPPPPVDGRYGASADTEGDPLTGFRYRNREIPIKLRVIGTTAADLHTRLGYLQQKVGKITREGGTLKRTTPSGLVVVFDLLGATIDIGFDRSFIHSFRALVGLSFDAKPFGRGPAVTLSDNTETTLPVLSMTVEDVTGDVSALGKLVIDEDDADDQAFLKWGLECLHYSSSANAALFYEAEGRTAQGGAAIATRSGASGGGSNNVIRQGTLTTSYQSMLSTQAVSAGAHLSHVGDFEVWARVYDPNSTHGRVKLKLEWAEGDFRRRTTNAEVSPPVIGGFSLVNLGQVHLTKVVQGTQRWEGRVLAKSSQTGDDIDIDCLFLFPVAEGSGEVRAVQQFETPTSISARDEFDQTAGALAGKTAPVGGVWVGAGDADDFQVETSGKTVQRTAESDTVGTGRYAISGVAAFAAQFSQIDIESTAAASSFFHGAIARYTDASNWLKATVNGPNTNGIPVVALRVTKNVAGANTDLFNTDLVIPFSWVTDAWYTLRLVAGAGGRWAVWLFPRDSTPVLVATGQDSALATGGALASGKPGFYDEKSGSVGAATTRTYDNFVAAPTTDDAAIFASQSLELRHDRVIREDSTGSFWGPISKYEGDYLLIPPAGREDRTTRIIVKGCRNDPDTTADSGIDDLSARLTYVPRYLVVP